MVALIAKRRSSAIALLIAACASLLILGGYCFVAVFYHTHLFKGTIINGMDMSNMSAEEAKRLLKDSSDRYVLDIEGRGGLSRRITGDEISRVYVDDHQVDQVIAEQNAFAWIFETAHERDVKLEDSAEYDEATADIYIDAILTTAEPDYIAPENAHLDTDEDGMYIVVPESNGTTLNEERFREAVTSALSDSVAVLDLSEAGVYEEPQVFSDDEALAARRDAMNKYLSVDVTYAFGDGDERLYAWTIHRLLVGEGADVSVSQEAVEELVDEWCHKYSTLDYDFVITNHSGDEQVVPAGGTFGWRLDRNAMIASVLSALENGTRGVTEDPVWEVKQYYGRNNNGLGSRYVEVDMAEQYLYVWVDGEIVVATPVVTGLPYNGRATDAGCFEAYNKDRNITLGSYEVQGYESYVNYWIAFNGGQGIHDATWRWEGEFGGETWAYDGSHGCVNVPYSMMSSVYNNVEEGEAVVLYY